jgi:hypothetical protein
MLPIKIRLEPTQDITHTTVSMSFDLAQPLKAWQLRDLSQLLRSWTRRGSRVVLPAGAPAEWFEDWSEELAHADVEVEFAWPRRGDRRDR